MEERSKMLLLRETGSIHIWPCKPGMSFCIQRQNIGGDISGEYERGTTFNPFGDKNGI